MISLVLGVLLGLALSGLLLLAVVVRLRAMAAKADSESGRKGGRR